MRTRKLRALSLFLAAVMLCLTAFPASATESATASTMQLMKTEGTVAVTNGSSRSLSVRDNMRLYNGYHVDTEAASYAWVNLDSEKLAKLDAVSEAEVRKSGRKLELLLTSGNIFFNVTSPLEDEETLNIRTSTMVIGIRGTSGWIKTIDRWAAEIYVLEGTVQCSVTDPVTGQVKTAEIHGGEMAIATAYPQDRTGDKCDIIMDRFEPGDINGFVLVELAQDPGLCADIYDETGMDVLPNLGELESRRRSEDGSLREQVNAARRRAETTARERLEQDEQKMRDALDRIEEELAQQENNVSTDGVWKRGSGALTGTGVNSTRGGNGKRPGSGAAEPPSENPPTVTPPAETPSTATPPAPSTVRTYTMPLTDIDVQGFLDENGVTEVILQASGVLADDTLTVEHIKMHIDQGKTLTLEDGVNITVDGTHSLTINGTMTGDTLTNNGTLTVNSSNTLNMNYIENNGTLTNSGSGRIVVANTITTSNALNNAGRIESPVTVTGGTFTITGGEVISSGSSATVTASTGAKLVLNGGTITNSGTGSAISGDDSDITYEGTDIRAKRRELSSGNWAPNDYGVTGAAESDEYYHLRPEKTVGPFVVTSGAEGTDYAYNAPVLTIYTATLLTIRNADSYPTTDSRIAISDTAPGANIALDGVNISASVNPDPSIIPAAFLIPTNYTGDVTITLAKGSVNELIGGTNCAALQKKGTSGDTGTLTITGSGTLAATGGSGGAGIGGSDSGDSTNITISGGTVTASGGNGGAGIGGGSYGSGSNITISGGTVTASGGFSGGAGIGGGDGGNGDHITISGSAYVKADGGNFGAGIGGGSGFNSGGGGHDITISGSAYVEATGGEGGGAGIGGGYNSSGSNITVSGGTMTASGGISCAGIGGGFRGNGTDITISGGTVTVSGGSSGAGIGGGGNGGNGDHITIRGVTITSSSTGYTVKAAQDSTTLDNAVFRSVGKKFFVDNSDVEWVPLGYATSGTIESGFYYLRPVARMTVGTDTASACSAPAPWTKPERSSFSLPASR